MIRFTAIGLAALMLAGAPAFAQEAPVTPDAPAATTEATQRFSVDTKMSALIADPKARVVVGQFFDSRRVAAGQPEMSPEESAGLMDMIGDLSPRELSNFPQANLDEEALEQLNALLAAIPEDDAQ